MREYIYIHHQPIHVYRPIQILFVCVHLLKFPKVSALLNFLYERNSEESRTSNFTV